MTKECSGSDSYTQIIDLENCKPIGQQANYVGNAVIQGNKLINSPAWELGVELPNLDKAYYIKNPNTPKAQLVE